MQKYSVEPAAGVTLLELLVVLAVAGILAALGAPRLRVMAANRQMEAAVEFLEADFRFARSEALKRGHSVTICRSSNATTCEPQAGSWSVGWIVFDDRDGDGDVSTGESVLRVQPVLTGIRAIDVTGTAPPSGVRYRFQANGIASGSNGRITLRALSEVNAVQAESTRLLCVSAQGRLAVQPTGATTC